MFSRIGDAKIPHFYHRPDRGDPCRLEKKNRGRHGIEPVAAWAALRRWRKRGLPEGDMALHDPIEPDARYMHISGPPGTRDTRIMLGDYTIEQVIEDAESPQGRGWDWFVHERNDRTRTALDTQGISYALFRFVEAPTTTTMQIFLARRENVGDWGRVERYEPAPNRAARPPKLEPTRAAVPSQEPHLPQEQTTMLGADVTVIPRQWNAPAQTRLGEPRPVAPAPRRSGATGRGRPERDATRRVALKLSDHKPRPGKAHVTQTEAKLTDQLRGAANALDEALDRGDRRDFQRFGRGLQKLLNAHHGPLLRTDEQWIRHLLSQVGTKR